MSAAESALRCESEFPEKLAPLFERWRYKILKGGRGSAKSWGIARALLQLAFNPELRSQLGFRRDTFSVLCGREFQSSIRDSVHKLLKTQIELMGLCSVFRVERDAIYGPCNSAFVFVGLSDKTKENMKSFEDFDAAWIEEAQVITQGSLDVLLPTIRRDGSEIWFSYNPQLDSDPIEKFATSLLPSEGVVIELHYRDNPWFNETLEAERQRAERTMPKIDYENIWDGKLRPAVEGAIYADEMAAMYAERRICSVPYDPYHLVYPVFDLGWNDLMTVGFCQRHLSSLRVIDYIEDDHKTYDWFSQRMRERSYNFGVVFMPHDAENNTPESGRDAKKIMEDLGWRVVILPRADVNNGIRDTRMAMKSMYIDSVKCATLIEHLKRYRRTVPSTTGEPGAPLHDAHSHGADMLRKAAQAAPLMDDEESMNLPPLESLYPEYARRSRVSI